MGSVWPHNLTCVIQLVRDRALNEQPALLPLPFGRKTFVAMCDHRCRFQSSNVYRTGKRIIRARHAITATDSFDALRRRTPPPPRLSRNPFATGQTLILFLLESIELNETILLIPWLYPLPLLFLLYLFLSLHLFFSLHLIYLLSFSYVFHVFLFFCSSFSLSWIEIRHRGGCKMIFRNEICNRV